MKKKELDNLKNSVMGGLPASEKKYSINEFKKMIYAYRNYQKKARLSTRFPSYS